MPVQKPFEGGFWHQLDSLFPWSAEINENLTTENAIDRSPTKAQKFGNLSNAEMFFDLLRGRYHQKRPLPFSLMPLSVAVSVELSRHKRCNAWPCPAGSKTTGHHNGDSGRVADTTASGVVCPVSACSSSCRRDFLRLAEKPCLGSWLDQTEPGMDYTIYMPGVVVDDVAALSQFFDPRVVLRRQGCDLVEGHPLARP